MASHELSFALPQSMYTFRRVASAGVVAITSIRILDQQAAMLASHLRETAFEVGGRLVLDVSGVARFSCAWINTMIDLSRRCDSYGGKMIVTGLDRRHLKLLRSTGIERHLSFARDQYDALRSLDIYLVAPWRLSLARMLGIPVAAPVTAGVSREEFRPSMARAA